MPELHRRRGRRRRTQLVAGVNGRGASERRPGLRLRAPARRSRHVLGQTTPDGALRARHGRADAGAAAHKAALVPGVSDAIDLIAGAGHACIRRKAGPLACWGELPWDAKKHPSVTAIFKPARITSPRSPAASSSCARWASGRDVWCAGRGLRMSQLGNGIAGILARRARDPRRPRRDRRSWRRRYGSCAVHRTGAVTCWGEHDNGPGELRGGPAPVGEQAHVLEGDT